MLIVITEGETIDPTFLVQVHQHSLFQLILAIVDSDGVIVPELKSY